MENIEKNSFFNIFNLLKIINKWKYHIVIIFIIAIVLGTIISSPLIITPMYKSYAIVYPSNIYKYSDESNSEQIIQWLNSVEVADSVIKSLDLVQHYKLNANDKLLKSTLYYIFFSNISIKKNQLESIEISALDKDPEIACRIVNKIIYYTNMVIRKEQRIKFKEVLESYNNVFNLKKKELDSIEQSLKSLREIGLYDYEIQSKELTRGLLRTIGGGSANINNAELQKLKDNLTLKGGELSTLNLRKEGIMESFVELEFKYDFARFNAVRDFTFISTVTPAIIADKKSFPKRWKIVALFAFASLLFSITTICIIENREIFKFLK